MCTIVLSNQTTHNIKHFENWIDFTLWMWYTYPTQKERATKERDKMALTKEDLQAISQLMDDKMDGKLKPIIDHLDIMEHKQDRTEKKVDNLRLDVAVAERDIRRDILELKDEMETVIEVLKMHDLIPN